MSHSVEEAEYPKFSDDIFEDDDLDRRSFARTLVEGAVDKVFTKDLAAQCWSHQLTVVLEAPNGQWSEFALARVADTVGTARGADPEDVRPLTFRRQPPSRFTAKFDLTTEVLNAIGQGRSVIGVFAPTSEALPMFTREPDVRLELLQPCRSDISHALEVATGLSIDADDLPAVNGFDLDALSLAVRPRASSLETLERLKRLVRPSSFGDDVPDLRTFTAFGAARDWALATSRTLDRLRSGDPCVSLDDLPRGVLLVGPPGTGKTLFAKALSKTLAVDAVLTSASDWLSSGDSHLGAVIKAMRVSVEQARGRAPCILFIDECDSIVDRDLERGDSVSWWLNFVNAVLSAVDGAVRNRGVILVGACNNLDRVDKALRRSGRLETVIPLGLPPESERASILSHYLRGALADADLRTLARRSSGRSGADLERAVREAKALAADAGRPVSSVDVLQVLSPVTLSRATSKIIALHEAGHSVVSVVLGLQLSHVDVDASVTSLLETNPLLTRATIDGRLTMLLAGRAAEDVLTDGPTSGAGGTAGSDLALATQLASLARARLGLGKELSFRGISTGSAELIENDHRMRTLVEADLASALKRAKRLIKKHKQAVLIVAQRLEADRHLTGEEVADLVRAHGGARWIF